MTKEQNKEPLSYKEYSISRLYETKCLAIHKPIPKKLLEILTSYVHGASTNINSAILERIVIDIEANDFDFCKIKSNLKNQCSDHEKNLIKIILAIDENYYDIMLDKIKIMINHYVGIKKINWYLSKADFNGLPLKCLIHDIKSHVEAVNDKLNTAKTYNDSILSHLNFCLDNISMEFKHNGSFLISAKEEITECALSGDFTPNVNEH